MSEWVSVLAVFWVLWALDGVRVPRRRVFSFVIGGTGRIARAGYARVSLPGLWPGRWRMTADDVPVSLSPAGICNRPVGAAGRPGEGPAKAHVWRWEEIREVGVADGWLYVNGARFSPNTGHVVAPELLVLARLAPPVREARIRSLVNRWFRPVHLRRRARVLEGRTRIAAALNAVTLTGFVVLSIYVVGDVASRIAPEWSGRVAAALPWILGVLFVLHVVPVIVVWRALRRLKPVRLEKRSANLFSALLLPPQALRLRSLAGEGYFPAQHPLAGFLAFGEAAARVRWGFNVIADLRWPIDAAGDSPLAQEIAGWFRGILEAKVVTLLAAEGVALETLLSPPPRDAAASCRYCPRCRDQFVAGPEVCPHGVKLRPLEGSDAP